MRPGRRWSHGTRTRQVEEPVDALPDARRVQPVSGDVVVGASRNGAAPVRHAERQQPVRDRSRPATPAARTCRRRYGSTRTTSGIRPAPREGRGGRTGRTVVAYSTVDVEAGAVAASTGVEQRPDGDDDGGPARSRRTVWNRPGRCGKSAALGLRDHAARSRSPSSATAARSSRVHLVAGARARGSSQPGSVSSSGDVAGGLSGSGRRRRCRSEPPALTSTAADALVDEVQLDLLERPLDQERGEGVHDRPHPGERQARPHADQRAAPGSRR